MEERLISIVDELFPSMVHMGRKIFDHPETGLLEYKASQWLCEVLELEGFQIQRDIGGLATAFKAVKQGDPQGLNIAFLAEYDALPEVGHGCGHHLVGTGSVYAAIALSRMLPEGVGTITVVGTPAEEDKGGKILLLEAGEMEEIDMALMAHPSSISQIGRGGRAITSLLIEYEGKQAHSANPSNGINALSAVIQTFVSADALFQKLPRDMNTNGIIINGGEADNIIPGYASCQFSIRGQKKADVVTAVESFRKIVKSVELLTGAKGRITEELIYAERYPNMVLEERYGSYLQSLGEEVIVADPQGRFGSSDMGNVSLAMPAMHPYYRVTDSDEPPMAHTRDYGKMCSTDRAYEGLRRNVISLASLGYDLLTDKDFADSVFEEYKLIVKNV